MSEEVTPQTKPLDLDSKVSPAVLAGALSRNVSLLYQWEKDGRLPSPMKEYTYRQCLKQLMDYHSKQNIGRPRGGQTVAVVDEEGNVGNDLHPLIAAKIQQSIKTEYSREAQNWQTYAIKNEEYISFSDKLVDVQGFITNIKDLLLGVAMDFPETQATIDEGMENLYKFGLKLLEEVKIDREEFVQTMLSKSTDELEELR
jgi:hypothetical protein